MMDKIRDHLKKQYKNVFTDKQIEAHINNHISENQSIFFIKKIEPFLTKDSKILDVGSGYGSFVLTAIRNGYDAYGIEIEHFEHEVAKERATMLGMQDSRFHHGSATQLPFANDSFDVVTFWNVLEHIHDYKKAILEAKRILRKGGKIFIVAPNYFSFRKEAHYHLPWVPLFPKPLARLYLKMCGRGPSFLDECIFYITNFGVKRFLKKQGFYLSLDISEKILSNYKFQSSKINLLVLLCKKLGIERILAKSLFSVKTGPFAKSIDLIAQK